MLTGVLLAGLVLGSGPARADFGVPAVHSQLAAHRLNVEGSLDTRVERPVAWAVLTDHEDFPRFVPGLLVSRTLQDRGRAKLIAQRGEITAGTRLRFDGTLLVEEDPSEGVRMRFLSGPFKDSVGAWHLTDKPPFVLTYRLSVDLDKTPLPPPMAMAVAEQQVRVWLAALVGEMVRRQGESR